MTVLVVAGFHRSGTSMVAELVHRAGVFLGDDLIGANASNPHGHFEDRAIVRFHDRVLADHDLTWQVDRSFEPHLGADRRQWMTDAIAQRARHTRWGFKDPRGCFFLDAWKEQVPDLRIIMVYRNPRDCAWSLERRHAGALRRRDASEGLHHRFWEVPDLALRMWVAHNRALLAFAERHPGDTILLGHADVLAGLDVVAAINEALGTDLERVDNHQVVEPGLVAHRPGRQAVSSTATIDEVLRVWAQLEARAARDLQRCGEDAHGHA